MLTISICDDNPQFLAILKQKLRLLCIDVLPEQVEYSIGPLFESAESLLHYLRERSIDILFLDVDMPEISGFDAAATINRDYPETVIVFVSAHEELVFNAFDYTPLYFLRKTHLTEELPATLKKAVDKCLHDWKSITLKTADAVVPLRLMDIMYFESDKNYYTAHCVSGDTYRCRGTLNALCEALEDHGFFRTHSAYLVNLAYVEAISGPRSVRLKNQSNVPLAHTKAKAFQTRYTDYIRRSLFR